jgi:4-amino-4-deoxy-L-arabinose transferase-like glycosyltransferase
VLLVVLAVMLPTDPSLGFTWSGSPFTDEGYNLMNARNLVLLGSWSTNDWALHLIEVPFSLAAAALFEITGVGLFQARAMTLGLTVVAAIFVSTMTQRQFGRIAGIVAGAAFAGSPLILYYGRLAYLEQMVIALLAGGLAALLAAEATPTSSRRTAWALTAGTLLALGVLTKASTVAPAFGIVAGATIAGGWRRGPHLRRIGVVVLAGSVVLIAWLVLVGLPNRERILTDLRILPNLLAARPVNTPWDIITDAIVNNDRAFLLIWMGLLAAIAGVVLAARSWRQYSPGQRMLVGGAAGWFLVGMLIFLASPYRPNRYVEPMVPALALLSGVAAFEVQQRLAGATLRAAIGVMVVGLALPGAVAYAGWAASATVSLPALQTQTELAIAAHGNDAAVEGELAPLFAMRAPVEIVVSRHADRVNPGDVYVTHRVRWVIAVDDQKPYWTFSHPGAWRERQKIFCAGWGSGRPCLFRLPDGRAR